MTTPLAPSGLGLVPGNAAVTLTWLAPSSDGGSTVTSYIVYRGTSQSSLSQISEVTSTATTDATPVNGVHYYYAIAARNSVGIGPVCSIADCTPAGTPSQPTNLVATASGSTILLSFTAPSSDGGWPITGYLVLRGTVAGGETSLATIGTATTYSDTGAVSGVKYFYKAAAINAIGTGAASNEASATVGAQSPPGIPTHLTGKYTSGVVKLIWSAPSQSSGITSYNVYRGTSTRNFVKIATIGPTTSYADASVVRDAVYYYRVTAVNPGGEGQPSSYASVYCYVRNMHSTISEQMFSPLAGLGSPAWILLAATCMCALGMVVLIPRSEGVREWWAARNRKR